ncbi:cytochrome c [Bacillus sp. T3]|uniref:c-type cytochrome n=1 Tax=Bacillus sp. T3 TaxID=467262 RepID=UPI002980EA9B|nr:cytochrome c [Bacillus sp. T3]
MKKIVILVLGMLFLLSGCGNDSADEPKDAEGLYNKSCVGCHGADLKGASGPALTNLKDKYSEEELHTLIMEGKGMMPGNLLSDEETQLMVDWLMTK